VGANRKLATLLVRLLGFVLLVWGSVNMLALVGSLTSASVGVPAEYRHMALWPGAAQAGVGILILLLGKPLGAMLSRDLDD